MEVKTVMRAPVSTVRHDAPLAVVRAALVGDRGGVVVVKDGRLVGVVSEREVRRAGVSSVPDLARYDWAALLDGVDAATLMTPGVVTVAPTASVSEATRLMSARRVRMLVVEEDGEPLGTVTARELLGLAIDALERDGPAPFERILACVGADDLGDESPGVLATAVALAREHRAGLDVVCVPPRLPRALLVERGAELSSLIVEQWAGRSRPPASLAAGGPGRRRGGDRRAAERDLRRTRTF